MIQNLANQRCFNHSLREAVARCPECGHCFCRECITEHEDRVVCAACLGKLAGRPRLRRPGLAGVVGIGQCLLGLLAGWFFFYMVGELLLAVPDSFHEATLWQAGWLDQP
jgi:hypothetical protein